jgi:uncharacterized membrane protein YphA (DoxX/SURF4 family)
MDAQLRDLVAVSIAFVAILFLYAGIAKILSLRSFRRTLLFVPYLPRALTGPVAVAVPISEVATGTCLLLGVGWAKVAAVSLLATFSVVAIVAHRRGQKVSCSCFGAGSSGQLSPATVMRNAVLICVTAPSFLLPDLDPSAFATSYGLVAFVLFLCLEAAIQNEREFREALNRRFLA